MKKYSAVLSLLAFLFLTASVNAQILADELRPFDFSDKFYEENGIISTTLTDRKNGADNQSVFDTPSDPTNLTNIRITATLPAYTGDGEAIFWNYYGGATRESIATDAAGGVAIDLAYAHPMFVFPSTTVRNSDRQAAMIRLAESYFEKNHIGIAVVFLVEYTDRAFTTKQGRLAMQLLTERNGTSLDGTPIIRTAKELDGLIADGLVTVRLAGSDNSDRTPYAVAKVLRNVDSGAIAPDAFLMYVKQADGKPLDAESHLVATFECYKGGGKCF